MGRAANIRRAIANKGRGIVRAVGREAVIGGAATAGYVGGALATGKARGAVAGALVGGAIAHRALNQRKKARGIRKKR